MRQTCAGRRLRRSCRQRSPGARCPGAVRYAGQAVQRPRRSARRLLDHCGLPRAALVGLSMGGETSLDFALAHPDHVSAPALAGVSVSGHVWPRDAESAAYAATRRTAGAAAPAEPELSIWASLGRTGSWRRADQGDGGGDAPRRRVTSEASHQRAVPPALPRPRRRIQAGPHHRANPGCPW
ncbi:alpha/beta fold hydrolase [Streptomyces sp. NPDC059991]|uniref:alpha/beta fold hydrolase n=1 Tax=Streptomyces sp. NPDC059991 TaxID=3347028 RepID=UPI0036AAB09E